MHKRGIMHRRIEAEVVGMKVAKMQTAVAAYSFKVNSLGGLNRVLEL